MPSLSASVVEEADPCMSNSFVCLQESCSSRQDGTHRMVLVGTIRNQSNMAFDMKQLVYRQMRHIQVPLVLFKAAPEHVPKLAVQKLFRRHAASRSAHCAVCSANAPSCCTGAVLQSPTTWHCRTPGWRAGKPLRGSGSQAGTSGASAATPTAGGCGARRSAVCCDSVSEPSLQAVQCAAAGS